MRLAIQFVIPLADDPAVFHDYGTHERVRVRPPGALPRQPHRPAHHALVECRRFSLGANRFCSLGGFFNRCRSLFDIVHNSLLSLLDARA